MIKLGVVHVNVHVLRHLKEELAWAIDKRIWVTSNKMLFTTVIRTTNKLKNKIILDLTQYCMNIAM